MNLKDFKKVGATGSHTIFEHPDGHLIHISNSNIPASLKKEMREIPMEESPMEKLRKKMAKGGQVPAPVEQSQEEEVIPEPDRMQFVQQGMAGLSEPAEYQPPGMFQALEPKAPQGPTRYDTSKYVSKAPAAVQSEAVQAPESAFEKEMKVTAETGEKVKSIQEQEASKEAQVYQTAATDIQNLAAKASSEKQRLQKMMDQVNQSIMNNEIDPGRYMANMGTVGKISTTLGLILGGIGAGMTGGPNLAYKALESAIDRDVESQKLDLNKKNNLLTAYYKMYGDVEQAEAATKAQIMSLVQLKANQLAAQSKSAQASEQNKLFQAQLESKKEQYQNQQAQLAADRQLSQMTQAPTAERPSDEQIYSYIDRRNLPDKAKADTKDAYTDYQAAMQGISDFKEIMSDQHVLSQLSAYKNPIQRLELLNTYKVALAPIVKAVTGETRMSDQEFKNFVEPLLSGPLTTKEALDKKIDIMIRSKMQDFKRYTTKLKGVGLNLPMPVIGESVPTTKK